MHHSYSPNLSIQQFPAQQFQCTTHHLATMSKSYFHGLLQKVHASTSKSSSTLLRCCFGVLATRLQPFRRPSSLASCRREHLLGCMGERLRRPSSLASCRREVSLRKFQHISCAFQSVCPGLRLMRHARFGTALSCCAHVLSRQQGSKHRPHVLNRHRKAVYNSTIGAVATRRSHALESPFSVSQAVLQPRQTIRSLKNNSFLAHTLHLLSSPKLSTMVRVRNTSLCAGIDGTKAELRLCRRALKNLQPNKGFRPTFVFWTLGHNTRQLSTCHDTQVVFDG